MSDTRGGIRLRASITGGRQSHSVRACGGSIGAAGSAVSRPGARERAGKPDFPENKKIRMFRADVEGCQPNEIIGFRLQF